MSSEPSIDPLLVQDPHIDPELLRSQSAFEDATRFAPEEEAVSH